MRKSGSVDISDSFHKRYFFVQLVTISRFSWNGGITRSRVNVLDLVSSFAEFQFRVFLFVTQTSFLGLCIV